MSLSFVSRLRTLRAELTALVLLFPLVVVLGLVLARFPREAPRPAATPTTVPASTLLTHSATTAAAVAPVPQVSDVTLEIVGPRGAKTYAVTVDGETTVADVLARAAREQRLLLETKDYGGSLGIFVEGIDGVRSDTAQHLYWTLYVNQQKSSLGASSARVRAGDRVAWRYEPMTGE